MPPSPAGRCSRFTWLRWRGRWVFEWLGVLIRASAAAAVSTPTTISSTGAAAVRRAGQSRGRADRPGRRPGRGDRRRAGPDRRARAGRPGRPARRGRPVASVARHAAAAGRRRAAAGADPAAADRRAGAGRAGRRRHPGQLVPPAHRGSAARAQPGRCSRFGCCGPRDGPRRSCSAPSPAWPASWSAGSPRCRPARWARPRPLRVLAELAHDDGMRLRPGVLARQSGSAACRRPASGCTAGPTCSVETVPPARLPDAGAAGRSHHGFADRRPPAGLDGPTPVDLTVRLAAPDTATLGVAAQALRKVVSAEHAQRTPSRRRAPSRSGRHFAARRALGERRRGARPAARGGAPAEQAGRHAPAGRAPPA